MQYCMQQMTHEDARMATTRSKPARRKPVRKSIRLQTSAKQPDHEIVAEVRQSFGATRKLFARMTGFSERSIAGWEGGRDLTTASRQRILEMQRLHQALSQHLPHERIADWLDTPNLELKNLKPIEVIERGEIDRLWILLYQLEAGIPD